MKVAFINGSPRKDAGITARLLRVMEERLQGCEIVRGWDSLAPFACEGGGAAAPGGADAILIAFPLYVDGIPSNLLRELIEHEQGLPPGTRVYALVNNGFYEGEQNATAISMIRNWCARAKLAWGQGVGVGAGEILKREAIMAMAAVVARGSLKRYNGALDALAANILAGKGGGDVCTRPGLSRAMYIRGGNISMRAAAKANGLSDGEIERRL